MEIEESKFAKLIRIKIIDDLVRVGEIDLKKMNEDEIQQIVLKCVDESEIELILNYEDLLIDEARNFIDKNKNELAILLYATWFEHWINNIIKTLARRKGLEDKAYSEIIRNTSFKSKYTWLLTNLSIFRR